MLFRLLITILITAAFIYFLIKNLNINDFKELINNSNIYMLVLAFFIFLFVYLVRSLRIIYLFDIKFKELNNIFYIVARHYLLNKILPVKIGELSLVYFLKEERNIKYSKGLASLIFLRLLDALVVPLFFIIAVLINISWSADSGNMFIFIFAILTFIVFLLLYIYLGKILKLFLKILELLPMRIKFLKKDIYSNLLGNYKRFLGEIDIFLKYRANYKIITLTILNRVLITTAFFILFLSFKINISFVSFIIGSTLSTITEFLPISGLGSFGAFEAGWTLGFTLLGYSVNQSLLTGFSINILNIIFTIIIFILGFFTSKYRKHFFSKLLKIRIRKRQDFNK